MADFGAVAENLEGTVFLADGVVDEELAVKGLFTHGFANLFRLISPCGNVVEIGGGFEYGGVAHIARVVDVLDEIIRGGPFDEDPAGELFEQSVGILVLLKEFEELFNFTAQSLNDRLIDGSRRVFSEFKNEPHRPVRNIDTVVVVGGIARREHAVG